MRPLHIGILTLIFVLSLGLTTLALADHAGSGLVSISALITNDTGSDVSDVQLPFNLSSQTLVDGLYVDSDLNNTSVDETSTAVAYMPGTGRVQMLACFNNAGGNETAACNNATADDITLPVTGAEVYEFAFDNQAKHLWLDISTAATATWTVQWQYWNGSSYVAFSGVSDDTNGFATVDLNRVTWDFPAVGLWPESTLHSISGYWVRAEVTAFTSLTVTPSGEQAWYETGRWWVIEDSIAADEQKNYEVQLGTTAVTGSATFTIAASADDGAVTGSGAGYPPPFNVASAAGTAELVENSSLGGGSYQLAQTMFRFDTSVIPDNATITSSSLVCYVVSSNNPDSRNLVWEWYNWETVAATHYVTGSQPSAHVGTDITALTTSADNTFALTNVHNVSKSGYTGLRAHVDGGTPSSNNEVILAMQDHATLDPCRLTVEWSTEGHHFYAPHADGYTLAAAAALEAGSIFHLKVAGHFDMAVPAGTSVMFSHNAAAFSAAKNTSGNWRVLVNGTNDINDIAMSSGYHVVELYQNGVGATDELLLVIDGVEAGRDATPQAVSSTPQAWIFAANNVLQMVDYIEYEVDQVTQFTHQIRDIPDHQLDDQTGNGFNATARYPDTISGYTESVQAATAAAAGGELDVEAGPEVLGDFGVISDYSDTPTAPGSGFFLFDVIDVFTNGLIPFQAMTALFSVGIVLGGIVLTARLGLNHALLIAFVMLALMAVLWRMAGVPGWWVTLMGFPVLLFLQWKRMTP